MRFEGGNLLGGIVVVDAELEVIRTTDNPVLAGDETTGSHRDIGKLEGFNDGLVNLTVSYTFLDNDVPQGSIPESRKTKCIRDL